MLTKQRLYVLGIVAVVALLIGLIVVFILQRSVVSEDQLVRQVLTGYLKAWAAEKPDLMYKYLSQEDQIITSADYRAQFNEAPVVPLAFQLKDVAIAGQIAEAQVALDWPEVDLDNIEQRQEKFILIKENTWRVSEKESLK